MRRGSSIWVLGALSTHVLGGIVPKPYEVNSTSTIALLPPYASGSGLSVQLPSPFSSEPSNTLISSSTPTSPNSSIDVVSSPPSTASSASSKSPTLEYPSISSSGSALYASPSSALAPDYAPVVVIVVSETEVYRPSPSSLVTSTPVLTSGGLNGSVTEQPVVTLPPSSSSTIASSALQSGKSVKAENVSAIPAALPTFSTIDLELLSSIFFSDFVQRSVKTRTTTTTTTIILTVPTPLPAPSSTAVSSAFTSAPTVTSVVLPSSSPLASTASPAPTSTNIPAPSSTESDSASQMPPSLSTALSTVTIAFSIPSKTSVTEFPTSPPFSYNPSASRGSATPITRPTPEPSSAEAAGSTLSTSSTPSSTVGSQNTGIPPAPSAAGASGGMIGRSKERVWWVAFFVPFMLMA